MIKINLLESVTDRPQGVALVEDKVSSPRMQTFLLAVTVLALTVLGMGYDSRIGHEFLKPGPGYGGSCFPKDTAALIAVAEDAGYEFDLLKAVIEADHEQRRRIAERVRQAAGGGLRGRRVAMWGVASRPAPMTCGSPRPSV